MMCLLLCFLWWATVSAWIYGKVLGFCYKPRLALTVKKDGKGTVHLLCCHTARAILPLPTSAGGARAGTEHGTRGVPDLLVTPRSAGCFPVTAQWGQSTASSLAFLSGMMTPFVRCWRASAQRAPAAGCPGDVSHCHRAQPPAPLLSTGTPSLFQLPGSASSF